MGWFNDAAHWVEHAGEDAVDWTEHAAVDAANTTADVATKGAEWTAQATVDAANWTAHTAEDVAKVTAKGFNDAGSWVGGAAESAWKATSEEASAIADGVESAGITIGTGFLEGAMAAAEGLEEGAEIVGEDLVAIGEYVSDHACSLALGAAIAGALVALSSDGEEEEATGGVAIACAIGDSVALDLASTVLAKVVVEPVYVIPGVSRALGHKDEVEDVLAFLITQACEEHKATVIASAGQFLVGALIYGFTSVVCEGKLPGGYTVWKGAQSELRG